jgi:hypothetical protein
MAAMQFSIDGLHAEAPIIGDGNIPCIEQPESQSDRVAKGMPMLLFIPYAPIAESLTLPLQVRPVESPAMTACLARGGVTSETS